MLLSSHFFRDSLTRLFKVSSNSSFCCSICSVASICQKSSLHIFTFWLQLIFCHDGLTSSDSFFHNLVLDHTFAWADVTQLNDMIKISLTLSQSWTIQVGQYVNLCISSISMWFFVQSHSFMIAFWTEGDVSELFFLQVSKLVSSENCCNMLNLIVMTCWIQITALHGSVSLMSLLWTWRLQQCHHGCNRFKDCCTVALPRSWLKITTIARFRHGKYSWYNR
jgi:hypothetical protein